jgi:hypothetical protein
MVIALYLADKSRSLAQGPALGAVRYAAKARLTRARDDVGWRIMRMIDSECAPQL